MTNLLSRLRNRIRYRRFDADLTEEIELHRAMKQRGWERAGLTPTEARRMSHRDMGNIALARESAREVWIASWFDGLAQDIRYAFRSLRGQPGFTIAACSALVLGIGLNTSLFTLFNAVALRPWAVADPGSVVSAQYVHSSAAGRGTSGFGIAEYRFLREHAGTFSGLMAWRQGGARLDHDETDRPARFAFVSGNYFDVLGVRLQHGRGFLAEEDRVGTPQAVAVIGHRFWMRYFAGDPAIIGRTFHVDEVPFTIVGVAPPGFDGTEPRNTQNFWVPLASLQLLSPDPAAAVDLLMNPSHCCSRLAEVDGVFVASLVFPARAYDETRARVFVSALYTALKADLSAGSVALTNTIPLGNARNMTSFRLPGEDEHQSRMIQIESVSPEYFALLNIPVVAGRHLDTTDRPGGAITINETMARRYWPDATPIGQTIVFGNRRREIVGIVRDAHTTGLNAVEPVYYELTAGGPSTRLLLRSHMSDPAPRVRAIVNGLDDRVLLQARPLASYRDQSLETPRAMAVTAGVVGLLALALASVGVFGVFSYVVHERTREIGIRMAIGARPPQVVRLVLRASAWATFGGVGAGVVTSFVVSRFLTGQLYGISRLDLRAYGLLAIVLTVEPPHWQPGYPPDARRESIRRRLCGWIEGLKIDECERRPFQLICEAH